MTDVETVAPPTEKEKWRAVGMMVLAMLLMEVPEFVTGFGPPSLRTLILSGVYWIALYAGMIVLWVRVRSRVTKFFLLVLLVFYPYFIWIFNIGVQPGFAEANGRLIALFGLTFMIGGSLLAARLGRTFHLANANPTPEQVQRSHRFAIRYFVVIALSAIVAVWQTSARQAALTTSSAEFVDAAVPAILAASSPAAELPLWGRGAIARDLSPTQIAEIFRPAASLGSFIVYLHATPLAAPKQRLRESATAEYQAEALYDKGNVKIHVGLVDNGDGWQIQGLRFEP